MYKHYLWDIVSAQLCVWRGAVRHAERDDRVHAESLSNASFCVRQAKDKVRSKQTLILTYKYQRGSEQRELSIS